MKASRDQVVPRILILSLVFPPDAVSTAQIMGELAVDLVGRGHEVFVVTTMPHFNRDPEAEARQPITPLWGGLLGKSDLAGIPVFHTLMPRKGQSILGRLLGWIGFHALSTIAALAVVPRPDVILCPSPPLTICVSAWLVGLVRGSPFVYNVQEIYPDIAIKLGALRNEFLIRALRRLEKWAYRRAAAVTVIAPRMLENLKSKGVPKEKLHVIPNFVDTSDFQPGPAENDFREELGLSGTFVVSYAGNLGPAQGLETVLEAAEQLQSNPQVRFVFVGGGSAEQRLRDIATGRRLENIDFLSYRPYSTMPRIYAASDVSLVPQALETGSDAVPSKVYRIMACARPVLAVTEPRSDLTNLVVEAGCGLSVPPGDPRALAEAIRALRTNPTGCREMGAAGRAFVLSAVSRPTVTGRYHELLSALARAARPEASTS